MVWWFKTPSCPLWRHCNVMEYFRMNARQHVAQDNFRWIEAYRRGRETGTSGDTRGIFLHNTKCWWQKMSTEAFYYQTRTRYKQFVIVQALVYVYIYIVYIQSVTTISIIKFITCCLFSNVFQWRLKLPMYSCWQFLPSGAHLGGPWPPGWAPEGREVSH